MAPNEESKQVGKKEGKQPERGNALPANVINELLKNNPSLASEMQGKDSSQIADLLRKMKLEEILTGMVLLPDRSFHEAFPFG